MLAAAVIVPIVRRDVPTLVFVRRAAHLRRNPGQIGFPGGLIDSGDEDAQSAAAREFEEELGLPRSRVRIVDRLDDVVTLSLTVTIAPFIGLLAAPIHFALDPSETQSVHEIPLEALYVPGALHEGHECIVREGKRYDVPSWLFDYGDVHVWGATARIVSSLVTRYRTADQLMQLDVEGRRVE